LQETPSHIPSASSAPHNDLDVRCPLLDLLDKVKGTGDLTKTERKAYQQIAVPRFMVEYFGRNLIDRVEKFIKATVFNEGYTRRFPFPKLCDSLHMSWVKKGSVQGFSKPGSLGYFTIQIVAKALSDGQVDMVGSNLCGG
jgi:hypothetical protein